ncbi:tail fiber assembly protein [Proteus columbae]|uniref:tail fiber assembly protein n=1 Tax=Proteus columbae TaxID=1987580 RepID=UPI00159AEEAC|nr:tail fiber assembly protein [Proteus columbae]QKJ48261.1 tail fiber assembly protein [Proteus vulgaris]
MHYFKSPENENIFAYDDKQIAEGWVLDGLIPLSEKEVNAYLENPLTKTQYIEIAEIHKQSLIDEAKTEISVYQTKLLLGRINEEEKQQLNQWLDYLDALALIDVRLAPEIIYPNKPH